MSFCEVSDEIEVATNQQGLVNIFKCVNKKVDYSMLLNGNQYLKNSGKLVLDKLAMNKEDNYAVCKIDIFKRGT